MEYIFIIIAALLIFVFADYFFFRDEKKGAREEKNEDHCEVCVRWSECNGVDEECPWR